MIDLIEAARRLVAADDVGLANELHCEIDALRVSLARFEEVAMTLSSDHVALRLQFARLAQAPIVAPRGQPTRELENRAFIFETPLTSRWLTYPSRRLSLGYVRAELRWYLRGDPKDLSILDYAKIWRDIVSAEGALNSNYGRAWFRDRQLVRCFFELTEDPSSRRAVVLIPNTGMFHRAVKDVPCTVYQNFRVRDGRLNASTHMRSQDAIFGMGNDLPAFVMTQEILAAALRVPVGTHALSVDSWHIYERHFAMLDSILGEEPEPLADPPPPISYEEALSLLVQDDDDNGPFAHWLTKETA